MKFISLSRAWWRKTTANNQQVDVGVSGPKVKISFGISDEPIETRSGFDIKDKRPFYESDPTPLFGYYHAYRNSMEYAQCILYTDMVSFKSINMFAITSNFIETENIKVVIEPVSYKVPNNLQLHSKSSIDIFKKTNKLNFLKDKNEWENNTSLRISSITKDGVFNTQKAKYFTQIATNITLDWASGKLPEGIHTIRSGLERPVNGHLKSLDVSILANTLGIAVMFYNSKLEPVIRVRSESLASIPTRGYHCTVSGVFEVADEQEPGTFDYSILSRGMSKEIFDEIGLREHEYVLFPISFARELPRGGKPQLFFAAISLVSEEDLKLASMNAKEAYEYVGEIEPFLLDLDNYSQLKEGKFTYEGWACLHYANQFVEANNNELRRIIRGKERGQVCS